MTDRGLAAGLLAVYCTVVALVGVDTHYSAGGIVAIGSLYSALALMVVATATTLARLGRPGAWVGAFGIALVALGQFREMTREPTSILLTLLLAAVAAPAIWWGTLRRPPANGWRVERLGVLAAIGLFAGVAGIFACAPQLRWHLLRHNTLLGTPAYYVLEKSIEAREDALFRERLAAHVAVRPPPELTDPARGSSPPVGPNVVFVILDTLRADALSAWEPTATTMARLDERLSRSWRFTDVWAAATWTRPSVASFITGLQPEAHGARGIFDALGEEHVTLAEVLQEWGYATAGFVTNLAALSSGAGFDQGFELYDEVPGDPYARAATLRHHVESWLDSTPRDGRPLFLYLHYLDPHAPYLAGQTPRWERAGAYRRELEHDLRYLDLELDQLLDRLEYELGAETVFVLASDHGEELFEHELFGHGYSLYQETLHVPVALWRAGDSGQRVDVPLEGRDLFDLVLAAASAETLDVAAWSQSRAREERYASLYFSSKGRLWLRPYLRHMAMRTFQSGSEKLIWSAYGDTWELYDLVDDPGETRNLAAARPDRVKALAEAMEASVVEWRKSTPLQLSDETAKQLRALGYVE